MQSLPFVCGSIVCTNASLMIHRQLRLVGTRMYALNGFLVMYSLGIKLKLSSSFSRCHWCNCQTGTTPSACLPEPELNWRFASKKLWLTISITSRKFFGIQLYQKCWKSTVPKSGHFNFSHWTPISRATGNHQQVGEIFFFVSSYETLEDAMSPAFMNAVKLESLSSEAPLPALSGKKSVPWTEQSPEHTYTVSGLEGKAQRDKRQRLLNQPSAFRSQCPNWGVCPTENQRHLSCQGGLLNLFMVAQGIWSRGRSHILSSELLGQNLNHSLSVPQHAYPHQVKWKGLGKCAQAT